MMNSQAPELDLTDYEPPAKYVKKRSTLILPRRQSTVKRDTLSSPAYFPASASGKRRRRLPEGYPAYRYARSATAAQAYRQPDTKPVKVHVHADMLKITYSDASKGLPDKNGPQAGGGLRGTVTGFSRASRKRMLQFMASVRYTGAMLFATMTFDDTTAINSDDWMLSCFEAFRKRFERSYPGWRALWRKEWQDRKSGDYEGMFVPHYHLLIFAGVHYEKQEHDTLSDTFTAWAKDAWQEITASTDENHLIYGFHCTPVRNRKHAYAYIGKYIGKTENNSLHAGRAWGRVGKFDCSVSETFALETDEYIALRRLIKRWLKTRKAAPPADASPAQIARYKCQQRKQTAYAKRFARQSCEKGCTVFGLGDTHLTGDTCADIFAGYWQIIEAARAEVKLRNERE